VLFDEELVSKQELKKIELFQKIETLTSNLVRVSILLNPVKRVGK